MRILVLNGGSSSLKCRLDEISGDPPSAPPKPVWDAHFDLKAGAVEPALRSVPGPVNIVGHRIVYGGPYHQTMRIDEQVRAAIAKGAEEAPAHNAFELEIIDTVARVFGEVPQIAVFDSGFHSTLEPAAYVYPGPYEWLGEGIRRHGFHGISYQYAARRASEQLEKSSRLVICHLGNGASVCAVRDGKSVETSMGFTPLEGLMMGTRSGSIDPGILIYLIRHRGYTAEKLDHLLNRESGLLGVSGVSSDMRQILAAIEQGNERAKLAFEIYAHRLVKAIGSMAAVLGGADASVFTGGVGENCTQLRDIIASRLGFLMARILVIHAEEEWEIARECYSFRSRE
jgi:acetate kinase